MGKKKICVLGGGVIGLSTALVLSKDYDVTIIADKFGNQTESRKATAIWHVYLVPETHTVLSWAAETLQKLNEISIKYPESGVEQIRGVELFRNSVENIPTWAHIPSHFELLDQNEIEKYNTHKGRNITEFEINQLTNHPVKWGYSIDAPAADMDIYLSWLESKLLNIESVEFDRRELTDINEISPKYDCFVNCLGASAFSLFDDSAFLPYKGQYFTIPLCEEFPRNYIGDDDHPLGMAYVIPRKGKIMIGGCAEKNVDDLELTLDWKETFKRASLYYPELNSITQDLKVAPAIVGVRPCRAKGVRLELDNNNASLNTPLIHNYGHGGSGFSLSWGCANSVLELIKTI